MEGGPHNESTTIESSSVEPTEIDSNVESETIETIESSESEPIFSEKELVFEEYADTPMAYSVNGAVYTAGGSAEAIMLCEFLQNEKLPAAFFAATFQSAAAYAIELEATKPKESDITDDSEEEEDKKDDDKKPVISVEQVSAPTATAEKQAPIEQQMPHVEPAEAKQDPKAQVQKVPQDTEPPKPFRVVKEPLAKTVVVEIKPEPKIILPKKIEITETEHLTTLIVEVPPTPEPDQETEATTVPTITLSEAIEPLSDSTENEILTPIQITIDDETPESYEEEIVATAPIETSLAEYAADIIEQPALETIPEANSDTEASLLTDYIEHQDEEVAEVVVEPTIKEQPVQIEQLAEAPQPVAEVREILASLNEEAQTAVVELDLENIEDASKITILYECLAAQVKEFQEGEKPVTQAMIEKTLELILEEAGVEESTLLAKFYIERYGVNGVLATTNNQRLQIIQSEPGHVGKLANLVMKLLVRHDNQKEQLFNAA